MVISFKIDSAVKEALHKLAKEDNRSLSNYISTLLMDHLKSKGINLKEEEPPE